jgi:beta-glucanase (GH16 family)
MVFSDDFPGTSLDPAKWATCYDWNNGGCTNRGSGEVEWYLPSQVAVAGGTTTLSAVRKDTAGTDGKVYPWLSGMLSTGRPSANADTRFAFTYGYAEALIKMPAQDLLFPAFWLLPADRLWPPEIDIVEIIGSRTRAWMTLHWKNAAGVLQGQHGTYGPVDFSAGYHDFALAWEPRSLTWYIDGVPRFSITDPSIVPSTPMELLFTLAIGVPRPPPIGVDSGTMSIRHVRVWQHN